MRSDGFQTNGRMELDLTERAQAVIAARAIASDWMERAVQSRHAVEGHTDATSGFLMPTPERHGSVLGVVIDPRANPWRVVTAYLDRRMRGRVP